MNKNRFCIIFNVARGLMMVVAENVKSCMGSTESPADSSAVRSMVHSSHNTTEISTVTIRPLAFSIMLALGLAGIAPSPFTVHLAHADIIPDQASPVSQRPAVINATNGVPLVNIQTPSAAGVSRNTYSQFDINTHGAILNNSRTNVQTQIGGFVQGNPYLASGTARIILNEVNSSNPSLLNGYIEVAGSRAQVVIANPAGISCNGCGFINASRATLTTGMPVINNGDLMGYRVGGGVISFLGAGLDTANSNYTDVIARAININAGLWAQDLNIIAGSNQINVASNGEIVSIAPISSNSTLPDGSGNPTPSFAIDVAALGGMYAGKIHMVGTEAGVGVRNKGNVNASTGDVTIDVNGQLTNRNRVASQTQTTIQATHVSNTDGTVSAGQQLNLNADSLSGDGNLLSGGNIAISLTTDYTQASTGQLQANGNLNLTTTGDISNLGGLLAGNTLTLNASNINNAATAEITGLNTQLNAANTLNNRGLIDGSDTFITAGLLNNIGTGSIFGDHLAIAANTLNNTDETFNSINTAAVIAARGRLDIGALNISNQNNSLLFSAGDMAIGGALDSQHQATISAGQLQTAHLINQGATIESLGNLHGNIADLQNLNNGLTTQDVFVGATPYHQFTPRDTSLVLNAADYPLWQIGNFNMSWRYGSTYGQPFNFREYWRYVYTGSTQQTQVLTSIPASILAGGNMTLLGNVSNHDSKIIAGGALDITGASLNNLNTQGQTTTSYSGTVYYYDYDGDESCGDPGDGCYDISASAYNPANLVTSFNLPTAEVSQQTAPVGTGTVVANINLSVLPNSGLFQPSPDPVANYLIETNPRFASYRNWLSSDYMLNQLSYDPALQTKRLGDGFYEQKLIREQINSLTGKRFLVGYADDEAQYQALMSNGATFAQSHQLIPGVALSAEQVAQLTSDIVWLVEQTITLPNGTATQALVPQLYVKLQADDLHHTIGIMAGNRVTMQLSGDLVNQGSIAGRDFISLDAKNMNNLGGQIQADATLLKASNDINNLGGQVIAKNSMLLEAGNDINLRSTTQSSQNSSGTSSFSRTNLDRVAGLYMNNPNAILVADAGNDINLQGAKILNSGSNGLTVLDAGNNLNLSTLAVAEQNNSIRNTKNYIKHGSTQEIGTQIQTTGDISLTAGDDIQARAADISSETGKLTGMAGNNISIESGEATSNMAAARYKKKSGTLSSKSTTTRDTFNDTAVIGSNLSADSINLVAGVQVAQNAIVQMSPNIIRPELVEGQGAGSILIKGSNVIATQDVNLNATGDIDIAVDQATHEETHYRKEKKSGLSATSTSVSYGSSKLTTTNNTQTTTNVGSTVGSVEGDVNINSDKTYTQTGSDILTPQGDINITAQQVNIQAATDTYANQQTMKYKQSGITLAISNPVISAIQTAQQMSQAASNTDDSRMQALAAGTTALAAMNAKDAIMAGNTPKLDEHGLQVLDANGQNTAENPANQVGGINVSLSIGSSKSSSKTTQTNSSAKGSILNAGGDISITAVLPELVEGQNEGAGTINVIGSQIKTAHDVTLKAGDQINLTAAENVDTLNSKNKSSSASVGVSVGTASGFAVTASASKGKGKTKGNGTTWTETYIQSGNQTGDKVTLQSGTDTTLKGAQVIGNQVIANVGTSGIGNLTVQSLQDTNTYDSKQKSAGISVSVPIGVGSYGGSISASSSKTKSNYASVNEQSGIMAGDGGFQVNVKGNTNLTGAVIASTDKAIQNNVNNLNTQTLTTSNIENSAEYSAKGVSFSAGVGLNQQPDGTGYKNTPTASAGSANLSGDTSSITVSSISGGTVNITDNTTQQIKSGKNTVTTVATLNRDAKTQLTTDAEGNAIATAVDSQGNNLAGTLTPIFDKQQVQRELDAQVQITQAFSQVAPKAVADFAGGQYNKLIATNPEEAAKWGDGGIYRVALHTIVGGLSGSLEGALGAGTSATVIPKLGEEIAKLALPAALNQTLIMATATAIGASVGGQAGAGTALSEATNNYLSHLENQALKKAIGDCSAGNDQACHQADTLKALDEYRDFVFHSLCDGNSASGACRDASIEMRQALATYAAPTQANKPITSEPETNSLLSGYTDKDELQSYVELIKASNQELTKEELGNDDKSQSPNLYNGDPYAVINRDIKQNYVTVKVGEQWMVVGTSEDQVYTDKAGVNGMQNPPIYASGLMGIHVENAYKGTNVYTLNYVPDNSFTMDLFLSWRDKMSLGGLTTTEEARFLSEVLQNVQENERKVDWVVHSRGGAVFTQAVNITPSDLSNNTVLFHAGANNEVVTQRILDNAGVKFGIGSPDNPQPPYKNSDADIVPNLAGFNGNLLQIIKSIIAIPNLSKGPLLSPHTLPPGYIVAPPRYTTPYTENVP